MNYQTSTIKAITDLLFLDEEIENIPYCNLVLVFGSNFTSGTIDALEQLMISHTIDSKSKIILSGNVGSLNKDSKQPEAVQMYNEAMKRNIFSPEMFILEPNATNCYENAMLSKKIIFEKFGGFERFDNILFVAKSFMTRRCEMSSSSLGYPMEKIHYYGLVDEKGRNIGKNNWWLSNDATIRVLAEVERIGKYAQKGDLSIF